LGLAIVSGFTAAFAGLAGLFSWVMAALADRDLFFQDSHILSARLLSGGSARILPPPDRTRWRQIRKVLPAIA
jgi:hypothetical protein